MLGAGNYTLSGTTVKLSNNIDTADTITIKVSCTFDTNNKTINRGLTAAPAAGKGGSVYIAAGGKFTANCNIYYNTAVDGGGIYAGASFSTQGSAKVDMNKKGTALNNVYLPEGNTINPVGSIGQNIYVTTAIAPTDTAPVTVLSQYTADYSAKIFSDNTAYHPYCVYEEGKCVIKLTSASAQPAFSLQLTPQSTNMSDLEKTKIGAGRELPMI